MSEWISAKYRLPPENHEVLFFATTNDGMTKEMMTGHYSSGCWKHCCMFYSSMTMNANVKVTHWRELPDYPKTTEPFVRSVIIDEPEPADNESVKEFAKKFCTDHADLLKRLADR